MYEDNHKYDDIIDLPHYASTKHKPMSMQERAAQFSSFSALSGLDDELAETARLTDIKLELSEDKAAELNEKLRLLTENALEQPEIQIEYFLPDETKEGGAYHKIKGNFRRYDSGNASVVLSDGTSIPVRDIYSIEGDSFERYAKNQSKA